MMNRYIAYRRVAVAILSLTALLSATLFLSVPLLAQGDPVEPLQAKPAPKVLPRPAAPVLRREVDENSMRALITKMVACGTRQSMSSWSDPNRGVGCARDHILGRFREIASASGNKLQVIVDKFETKGNRTGDKPVHMENVYSILPGSDPALSKTVFIISGHFDSRASDVMNPALDAPGADDDASGAAVSVECARLLSHVGAGAMAPTGQLSYLPPSPVKSKGCSAARECSNG